jgi:hypothetical protein
MIKTYIYKSFYYDRKGNNIDPFYIVHKSKNIKTANQNAMYYFNNYILDKYGYRNELRKNVLINTIRLNKKF